MRRMLKKSNAIPVCRRSIGADARRGIRGTLGPALCLAIGLALGAGSTAWAAAPAPDATRQKIEKGDIVRVEVAGRQDLTGLYTVDSNGALLLPLIGSVNAAGRSISDLTSDLSRRYSLIDRDILRVGVALAEYRTGKIYVLGGGVRPGAYSLAGMPNVWDAMAEAGGATQDAILSAVEVIPADASSGRSTRVADVA